MDADMNLPLKKCGNRLGWGILLYNLIITASVTIAAFFGLLETFRKKHISILTVSDEEYDAIANEFLEHFVANGTIMILGILLGIGFLILFFRKTDTLKTMWNKNKKITAGNFLKLLCIFMASQLVFSFVSSFIETGLNFFGYTAMAELESATGISTTISMFLYAGLVAPVAEELVYRGFVMHSLKPYGKQFAIITSSVIFGIMHGNIHQIFFATAVGFILGYVAMEYSLGWAIILHMINNCFFGDIMGYLTSAFPESVQIFISWALYITFFIAAIIIICRNKTEIKEFYKENPVEPKNYFTFFLSAGMIIFIISELYAVFAGITKL